MRLAELAALMQRTEGVLITKFLSADRRVAKESGVRISHAGGLVSWTVTSIDNGFLNRALGFGSVLPKFHGRRLLYTEVDWVRPPK